MKKTKTDSSIIAMIMVSAVIVALFAWCYVRISAIVEKRCVERMQEGANTAIGEIKSKLARDKQILGAAASLLSAVDDFDKGELREMVGTISPLMETARIHVLLPDNSIITPTGETLDNYAALSFEEEAAKGEHITGRNKSVLGKDEVMRHFMPIVQNGKTAALIYSITVLDELPEAMNIDNIYNASAGVYIIDRNTGDFIMDTWHENLSNVSDFSKREMKKSKSWEETAENILDGRTGYDLYWSNSADEWVYLYYAPADINDWEIAVSVASSVALANLMAIKHVLWVAAAIMLLAIVIYYIWVFRRSKVITERAVEQAVLETRIQKAEAAERAKTMFLSNMSHDIRTPMNAIIGFTTLAQTNIKNPDRVQEYLAKILSSSEHLLSLINDVLDMSRIESGRFTVDEKECRISDIFKDMRNIIQTQMQAKQLNFFMDTIDVKDENIYCDKLHLNQVLLNLLSNAIKFTPAGGSVSLMIKQKQGAPKGYGAYEIRVKDTGIGMSAEFLEHVFEVFERERTSTVSGIQGTGLGMPIAKNIVEAMGGTIKVESEQGAGTEITINLEFKLVESPHDTTSVKELEGLRALVVDDNFVTCDSVSKMLMQIGLRAEWTMHGREAVLRAKQAKEMNDEFYAYIIDWALPDLGGIEVVRRIRAAVGETTPIIVLTAYDWSMFEEEAREAGVTAFCNKPLFISELRDTLINSINREHIEKEEKKILPDTAAGVKGKRLLLVEDNELNREIAQELLSESGFEVECAENGAIAVGMVNKADAGYYDLVLMDVQMPVMDGYAATTAIRAMEDKTKADIPIVAMTANAFDEDKKKALDSGMNAHVSKPIDIKALLSVISEILKGRTE